MSATGHVKFPLGAVVATPDALKAIRQAGRTPQEFLARHAAGDWGEVVSEDAKLNDEALTDGSRLLSAYTLGDGRTVWAITEAADDSGHRAATTLLLPEEY